MASENPSPYFDFFLKVLEYNNPKNINYKNKEILFTNNLKLKFDYLGQLSILIQKFWFLYHNLNLPDLICLDFRFFYSTKYDYFIFDFDQIDFIYVLGQNYFEYIDNPSDIKIKKIKKVVFEIQYPIPVDQIQTVDLKSFKLIYNSFLKNTELKKENKYNNTNYKLNLNLMVKTHISIDKILFKKKSNFYIVDISTPERIKIKIPILKVNNFLKQFNSNFYLSFYKF